MQRYMQPTDKTWDVITLLFLEVNRHALVFMQFSQASQVFSQQLRTAQQVNIAGTRDNN